jgi:hypothetical protein
MTESGAQTSASCTLAKIVHMTTIPGSQTADPGIQPAFQSQNPEIRRINSGIFC